MTGLYANNGGQHAAARQLADKSRLANPVSYLFAGFSTEQVKLLASLLSPDPLYQAF
jgi:hypothetical protein